MKNNLELAVKIYEDMKVKAVGDFNPADFVTVRLNEKGEEYTNMEAKYQNIWFRKMYPDGKIVKKALSVTKESALIEASVYTNKEDSLENCIANAVAQRFYDPADEFSRFYLESAETAAEARALERAGFGFPTYNGNLFIDANISGKAYEAKESYVENKNAVEEKAAVSTAVETEQVLPKQTKQSPVAEKINDVSETVENNTKAQGNHRPTQNTEPVPNTQTQQSTAMQNIPSNVENMPRNSPASYTTETPVDELLKIMTLEDAEKYVVKVGFNSGKTLRDVALKNYKQLKWFFESYDGSDNILKAGAKLLFDRANQQQAG